jgi:alkylation response protein AidB-like acyl-CoA dehydrogenase
MAYKFAEDSLEPKAAEWDKTKEFPVQVFKEAAELGFGGIYVSEE